MTEKNRELLLFIGKNLKTEDCLYILNNSDKFLNYLKLIIEKRENIIREMSETKNKWKIIDMRLKYQESLMTFEEYYIENEIDNFDLIKELENENDLF